MSTAHLYKTIKLLTVLEAAKYISVSADSLRRWDAKGLLTPIRTPGGQRRYTIEQLNEFVTKRKNKSLDAPPPPLQESLLAPQTLPPTLLQAIKIPENTITTSNQLVLTQKASFSSQANPAEVQKNN